jgi:hypothetical protein
MDMKRILQAMDGVATKPVAGANDMAKFLRVVSEANVEYLPPDPEISAQLKAQANARMDADSPKQQAEIYVRFSSGLYDPSTLPKTMVIRPGVVLPVAVAKPIDPNSFQASAIGNAREANSKLPKDLQFGNSELAQIVGISSVENDNEVPEPVSEDSINKFLSIVDKNNVSILNEGANPHKVSLPVQMAMQHYQQPSDTPARTVGRTSTFGKYFHKVEAEVNETAAEEQAHKRQLINQYASVIAERVLMKEAANPAQQAAIAISKKKERQADESLKSDNPCWTGYKPVGTKKKGGRTVPNCVPTNENEVPGAHSLGFKPGPGSPGIQSAVAEAPIAMDPSEPNNPMIHGHQKANAMTLKGRIMSARAQLKELAQLAERDDLLAWEEICKKSKGGMFMGLEQNLEQIRHGIEQLAEKRRKGGVASRGIDKHIGEAVNPTIKPAIPKAIKPKTKTSTCRTGQTQTGMQTKDGKLVPKCSVTKKGS